MSMTGPVTLVASEARTASDVSASFPLPPRLKGLTFILDMTAALKDVGDKLDVWIQENPSGTIWNDIIHFAQILGNASASQQVAIINCEAEPEIEVAAVSDAVMAVSTVRQGPVCSPIRVKWVVTPDADPAPDQSFTFAVYLQERW